MELAVGGGGQVNPVRAVYRDGPPVEDGCDRARPAELGAGPRQPGRHGAAGVVEHGYDDRLGAALRQVDALGVAAELAA